LIDEIEGLKKDLELVKHPSSIRDLKKTIEHTNEVLEMWKKHASV
jgi:hypothetical protein